MGAEMAEFIYPEAMRQNYYASTYSEIAMESYYYARKNYDIICENDYSYFKAKELCEMEKNVVKTVVFSAMAIESYLNDYAAACLGDKEFYDNFDRLSAIGKFQLIAKFILKSEFDKGKSYYCYLKELFSNRDAYIHNKSQAFDMEGCATLDEFVDYAEEKYKEELKEEIGSFDRKSIDDFHKCALNSLKTMKEVGLYFDKYDANRFAINRLFTPTGILAGDEKEKEYKSFIFPLLNIPYPK